MPVRILINSKAAGALIGKQGGTIKTLRQETYVFGLKIDPACTVSGAINRPSGIYAVPVAIFRRFYSRFV